VAGRRDAQLAAFVNARGHGLLRLAFLMTGDEERARELLEAALADTYRHWHAASDEGLDRYVRNRLASSAAHRRHPVRPRRPSADARAQGAPSAAAAAFPGGAPAGVDVPTGPAGPASAQTLADRAWRALPTLTPRQRVVLVLRLAEDLGDEEIAEILGVTPHAVHSDAEHGLARLRLDGAEPGATIPYAGPGAPAGGVA
jgi:RNA polymerase sigma factor (sigma-70 family)